MKILESYKYIAKSLFIEASQDDEDYVSIGWGKYKEKDSVDDPTAPTFKKDDSGAFIPAKGGDKEKPSKEPKGDEEKPKSKGLKPSDFERDFDDSEPEDKPFGGDTGKDADRHQSAISSFADDYKETEEHEGESAAMDSIDNNIDDYITGTLKIKRGTPEYEEEFDKMHDEVQKQINEPDDSEFGKDYVSKFTGSGKKEETIIINGKKYHPIKEKNNG